MMVDSVNLMIRSDMDHLEKLCSKFNQTSVAKNGAVLKKISFVFSSIVNFFSP